mmetsp:Transcript_20838/g.54329  ORF Transcript_20838/g.54329 Transcript_20838/m.54329 type:complete len:115 (-) Transcript_20838:244-588(-)
MDQLQEILGVSRQAAQQLLADAEGDVNTAVALHFSAGSAGPAPFAAEPAPPAPAPAPAPASAPAALEGALAGHASVQSLHHCQQQQEAATSTPVSLRRRQGRDASASVCTLLGS